MTRRNARKLAMPRRTGLLPALLALAFVSTAVVRANETAALPSLPPPPQIEGQIELPKQSPMDRQKSTAQVKAMQLMESQKSGMMCQAMQQMAMKEQDPNTKMMMFAMAQQSCNSSEASKKAAEENEKNRQLISQEDAPKMQKLKASPLPLDFGQQKGTDETQNLDAFKVKLDENYRRGDDSIPTTNPSALVAALTQPNAATGANAQVVSPKDLADAAKEVSSGGAKAPSMSGLPGIPNADGKSGSAASDGNGGPAGGGLAMGGLGGGAGGAAAGADPKTGATPDGSAVATAERKKNREIDAGSGAGGGGGEAPAKSGGNDPFEALLAQMLGGPPAAAEGTADASGETVAMESASKSQATTNIFEYATLRYRRLANTQQVVAQSRSRRESLEKKAPTAALANVEAAAPSAVAKVEAAANSTLAKVAAAAPSAEPKPSLAAPSAKVAVPDRQPASAAADVRRATLR